MDRGVVHKSSAALVREMGEAGHGHGWWSMNNLMRPPFEQQHHPSLFMPSTTTTTGAAAAAVPSSPSSSALHSFSSLLLSNHYPLPTTTSSTSPPWQHDSSSTTTSHGQQQDSWIQLIQGGLSSTGSKESQMEFPTTICSEAAGGSGGSYVVYGAAAAASGHGSSTTSDVEIQFPWGSSSVLQQNKAQQKASSPRSSSITTTTTTSLGSNMLEFSNNSSSSPRESISTASGSAFKKARTQEPSPAQSTVKVRKEKLGDRITALHQLVSPFGKTDTASVLLEAIGYIRFLHGQIEALSLPYVGVSNGGGGGSKHQQQLHEASVHGESRLSIFPEDPGQLLQDSAIKKRGLPDHEQKDDSCDEAKKDLRSRGLCLVPVSCTLDVGVDVVAGPGDYWAAAAPAFGMGFGG